MNDLDIAKRILYDEKLTLVVVKKGVVIFETNSHRISGFLGAIEKLGTELEGAVIADRVAGKAVALLCVYCGIAKAYAEILSKKARSVFEDNGIPCEWKTLVDNILDLTRSGLCQFEKTATDILDPEKAYKAFKALQQSFKACK